MADELGVPVSKVIEVARDHFDWFLSSYTRVPAHIADKIRQQLAHERQAAPSSGPTDRPRHPVPNQAAPRPLHPFLPQGTRKRRPWVRVADLPKLEQLFARRYVERENSLTRRINPDRLPPDVHFVIQREARSWAECFFDDRQTAQWLAIGVLSPSTAQECCEAGITPDMLLRPFRMAGKPLHGGHLTLKQALDCQEVSVDEIRLELMRTGVLPGQERHI